MSAARIINLVGGRGYTGSELLTLIAMHPQMDLGMASSRSHAGQSLSSTCDGWPDDGRVFTKLEPEGISAYPADAWVLALPNGLADRWVRAIRAEFPDSVVLDLSADYRFDPQWTYGLPERFRDQIGHTKLIANPGCYATGSQLGLLPLKDGLLSAPVIFGVSGYSGAGKTPSPRNDPDVLRDNLIPYALSGHMHEKEVSHQLQTDVRFMPHVAAFFRGISLTIAFELDQPTSVDQLEQVFLKAYTGEARVRVSGEIPEVRAVQDTPDVHIGGFTVDARNPKQGSLVVVLDNLLKGAASQAMQNLNLALGLEEYSGINL
ncbi:MAG: N-acetyl-gamma-glutamyl-phosphate reductase [Gammaproteobacteria bacterium]|nr:N-acetyl-gamma-glutamyl-phosphate reductase [Gammaproteobacteria bacterium]